MQWAPSPREDGPKHEVCASSCQGPLPSSPSHTAPPAGTQDAGYWEGDPRPSKLQEWAGVGPLGAKSRTALRRLCVLQREAEREGLLEADAWPRFPGRLD